ncbi:hypothetical protein LOAG_06139 [Loa loa]|uniref:Uncharacterized protein n=1 Tax=Loa loa TaxID=7209 RepID=A0A1S0TYA3_LOALO|nr:hypothetical protein LOAG_06139 [Loa loa]EFO22346.1 hypothetical protein LOAG_06139 [Loa loa]
MTREERLNHPIANNSVTAGEPHYATLPAPHTTCAHMGICLCTHAHIHTHTHAYTGMYTRIYKHIRHTHTHTHTHTHIQHACSNTQTYIYIYIRHTSVYKSMRKHTSLIR